MKRNRNLTGPERGPKFKIIREKKGLQNQIYKLGSNGIIESEKRSASSIKAPLSSNSSVFSKIYLIYLYAREIFSSFFLPEGFPDSVSSDYLSYQIWDTTQALCSTLTGLLSTKAVLQGFGVGNAEATAVSATVQWIIRNGTGMVAGLWFAWWQGTKLGQREKFFRLLADVLCDLGNCMELLSPMFLFLHVQLLFLPNSLLPSFNFFFAEDSSSLPHAENLFHLGRPSFLFFACLGSFFKAIVGVAGSATRAFLTQHQAKRDNLADVAAKDGSQETAVNLIGLILGLVITPLLDLYPSYLATFFLFFTFLHLFANYKAVRNVIMDTLNRSRASVLLSEFFTSQTLLSPTECNRRESVFQNSGWKTSKLYLGCRVSDFFPPSFPASAFLSLPVTSFLLRVSENKRGGFFIYILFHDSATDIDILRGYFYAETIRNTLEQRKNLYSDYHHKIFTIENEPPVSITRALSVFFNQFIAKAKISGWNCSGLSLGDSGWRASW